MVGFCHGGDLLGNHDDDDHDDHDDNDDNDDDNDDDDCDGDGDGFPANPHHDKIPPWGEFVINGHGGILSSAYSHHGYS